MNWKKLPPFASTLYAVSLLALLAILPGCAAATVATAGSVAGLAATVVSTGADVYHLGKLDSVEMARQEEMISAVRLMATDLHMAISREKRPNKNEWTARLTDDQGMTVDVTIDQRTETMSRCRINVGLFGSEPTARVMLLRLREHLPIPPQVRLRATTEPAWPEDPRGPTDDGPTKIRRPPRTP